MRSFAALLGVVAVAAAPATARNRVVPPLPVGSILFSGGPGVGLYGVGGSGGRLRFFVSLGGLGSGSWSPNGKLLAYTHSRNGMLVAILNKHDRSKDVATFEDVDGLTWSPDSSRLAFSACMTGSSSAIFVIDLRTRKTRQITQPQGSNCADGDFAPRWSPKTSPLLFLRRNVRQGSGLWLVRPNGSRLRRLTAEGGGFGTAEWAPDGRRIVFEPGHSVAVVDRVTGKTRSIVPHGDFNAAWAPDGRWIALSGSLGDQTGTFLVRPDGRRLHEISTHGWWSDDLVWSPGSRAVAVSDEGDIWVIRTNGSGGRRITSGWRYGYDNDVLQWQTRSLAALPGEWVPSSPPSDSVVQGTTLLTTYATSRLTADGSRAFVQFDSHGCAETWDAATGAVERLYGCSYANHTVAVADDRLAWSVLGLGPGVDQWAVWVGTLAIPNPSILEAPGAPGPIDGPVGAGSLLVFSTWGPCRLSQPNLPCVSEPKRNGMLWRIDGTQQLVRIAASAGPLTPLDVNAGRILVDREDGTLSIYAADGTLERSYSLGARPKSAALGGNDLVVLQAGVLEDLDVDTGALRGTWPLAAPVATLAGVQNGIAAYFAGADVHLLRLSDGSETSVHAGPNLQARLTSGGLFYSYTTADTAHPGRIVFVPFAQLRG